VIILDAAGCCHIDTTCFDESRQCPRDSQSPTGQIFRN